MTQRTDRIHSSNGHKNWLGALGDLWCSFMHASPTWPIHGHYHCGICGRRYPVPWGEDNRVQTHNDLPAFVQALAGMRK
jgi:hypothetical protein